MLKTSNLLASESIDLAAEIAILNRPVTPVSSLLMQMNLVEPAEAVKIEWREKSLNSDDTPALEGANPAELESTRALKDNYCMILSKAAKISGTAGAVSISGVPDILTSEVQDRLLEVKRGIEKYAINGVKTAESGSTPRQMAGLLAQIDSGNVVTNVTFDQEQFLTTVEKVWRAGVMGDYYCFVNSTLKKDINSFAESNTRFVGTEQVYGVAVAKYITDFGIVNFVLSNQMPVDKLVVGQIEFLRLAELRTARIEPLAKVGDYIAAMVVWEGALKLLNSKAFAMFDLA